MLTTPNHPLVLHILGNGVQEDLLRGSGKTDGPVVLWNLFLALLESRSNICFHPVYGNLPSPHDYWECPRSDTGPQHSWMRPIKSQGLFCSVCLNVPQTDHPLQQVSLAPDFPQGIPQAQYPSKEGINSPGWDSMFQLLGSCVPTYVSCVFVADRKESGA